jgi:hypothetical protein
LIGGTADAVFYALERHQGTQSNIDKIFSEIWPKRPPKKTLEPKGGKRTKTETKATGAQAEIRHTGAYRSQIVQTRMALGDSATSEDKGIGVDKGFDLKVGDRVMHSVFGKGKIVSIVKGQNDYQISVKFADRKTRALSWRYASLTKL